MGMRKGGEGDVEVRKVKMYHRGRNGEGKGVCVLGMDGK